MQWHIRGLLFVLVGISGGVLASSSSANPNITAQGFAIDTVHSAAAGRFEPIRLRVEAPERIAKLLVSQDGFEVDLATTPDRSLFALFGLDKRPMNAFDVTLDFAPYVNDRFAEPGSYRIDIIVVDRKGGQSQASLAVTVVGEEIEEASSPRLEESEAVFRRQGSGDVDSGGVPGLTWVTIEPVDVTIRLRAVEPDTTLHQAAASSWSAATRDQLATNLAEAPSLEYLDIPTARGQADGTLVALRGAGGDILIRLTGSDTSVSSEGTTVTLTASVRR